MIYCNSGTVVVAAAGPLKRVKTALMQHFFNQFPVGLMASFLLKAELVIGDSQENDLIFLKVLNQVKNLIYQVCRDQKITLMSPG